MRQSAPPLARRFHRKPGTPLRAWERCIVEGLHSRHPEKRLWANVLADALYAIFRGRIEFARDSWDWVFDPQGPKSLQGFETLAEMFDIDPDDVRRDLLAARDEGTLRDGIWPTTLTETNS